MIHLRHNGGMIRPRGSKWLAEVNHNYGQKRKVCASQEDCRAWIDSEQLTARRVIPKPNQRQLIDADDARNLLPKTVSLRDAARYWLDHHKTNPLSGATLANLYAKYLAEKTAAGLRPTSLESIRTTLGRLADRFKDTKIADITPSALMDHLNTLHAAPVTRNNLRRYWLGFFDFCRRLGAIQDNPASAIAISRVDATMPGIFTPAQARALLTASQKVSPSLIPVIAIGLFAGLRSSELLALDWQDISPTHIRIIPEVAKKRRQRLIPLSATLRPLIAKHRAHGRVCPVRKRRLYELLKIIAQEAGIQTWPSNAMRHSFASYHLALYQDAGRTAAILGHTQNSAVLWDHYRELVTEQDARRYFAIRFPGGTGRNQSGIRAE
ncbi:MAG: tyrosine-type recombinase/integrase [Patescibacteria group bacterium]